MATHSSILAWEIPQRGAWWSAVAKSRKESDMTEQLSLTHSIVIITCQIQQKGWLTVLLPRLEPLVTSQQSALWAAEVSP